MTSKQGYGPDLHRFLDKRLIVKMAGKKKLLGKLIGYDDFMNITLDETHEFTADQQDIPLGKTVIRGNAILMWEIIDKVD